MSGLRDVPEAVSPLTASVPFTGAIWDVRSETFELPEATQPMTRQFIAHPGAVAIAVIDDAGRILLIRQYRHPVLARDWEVPAGLLDVAAEAPVTAAARELGEEADLQAARWHVLADLYTTPGSSSETIRIFLARDVSAVPEGSRHVRSDEELGIEKRWVDVPDALAAVYAGRILNATTQLAILHAAHALGMGTLPTQALRPADAPWPALDTVRAGAHARVAARSGATGAAHPGTADTTGATTDPQS